MKPVGGKEDGAKPRQYGAEPRCMARSQGGEMARSQGVGRWPEAKTLWRGAKIYGAKPSGKYGAEPREGIWREAKTLWRGAKVVWPGAKGEGLVG